MQVAGRRAGSYERNIGGNDVILSKSTLSEVEVWKYDVVTLTQKYRRET